ncbi:transposase [Streptomyces platensis]|uniref:transposase n=1 Tax=Streptomyces platensis TaxID=58346 RepID=UPI002E81A18C|nr:transposase [Streptomyces platensis]WTI52107.1 transposase [Streptomyces platensis]WUB82264.1 transposase [Streptomyces platensis]
MRAGAPWRDVPARYGPWGRVHDLFRRRQRDGTWSRIVTRLPREWLSGPRWGFPPRMPGPPRDCLRRRGVE